MPPATRRKGTKRNPVVRQTSISVRTGKVESETLAEDLDDVDMADVPGDATASKGTVFAELANIVLRPGKRIFALRILSPRMIAELSRIYQGQKSFMMEFNVPEEIVDGEVRKWKSVEFETTLIDLSLRHGKATCHGHIDHEGAAAMSELIQHWNGQMRFSFDGIQQSLF